MMMNKEIVSMIRDLIQRKEYGMRAGQSDDDDLLGMLLQSGWERNNLELVNMGNDSTSSAPRMARNG